MRKCRICEHYRESEDDCKYCNFEYWQDYPACDDNKWDILNLKEEDGWEHHQILDRLHYKGIDCYMADIWFDNDMAYLMGCYAHPNELARVLGLHEDVIYCNWENGLVLLNLFQEKYLRGELE